MPGRFRWQEDFLMSGDESAVDAQVRAPLVFAGYGVTAPDQQYDDYAGLDGDGRGRRRRQSKLTISTQLAPFPTGYFWSSLRPPLDWSIAYTESVSDFSPAAIRNLPFGSI
jgi:hypothetical protein